MRWCVTILFSGLLKGKIMELDRLLEIKKLAIIAMFSDDDLMDTLVLKGGNLLDVVYQVASRASIDLDFSMAHEFTPGQWSGLGERIQRRMSETFYPHGYEVFDVKLTERPAHVTPDMADFWGGYRIEFKVMASDEFIRIDGDMESARKQAEIVGPGSGRKFKIDVSKFEYCSSKIARDFDDYRIYIYSPEMLLFEKLRAICQQMPEYAEVVNSPSQSSRARDFFDIHTILENFTIDLDAPENHKLLEHIFAAKRVPRELLGRIEGCREFHREDFLSVKDTVKPDVELEDFDFYFDYVISVIESLVPSQAGLKTLREENPPLL